MGGSNIFAGNAVTVAPWDITYDADGTAWMYAIAHTTLVINTPYLIVANEFGPITSATTATYGGYIGVATEAGVSGAKVKLKVGGYHAAMVTPSLSVAVGHGLTIASNIVADSGADYIGTLASFAVCVTATTTATATNVQLVPKFTVCG